MSKLNMSEAAATWRNCPSDSIKEVISVMLEKGADFRDPNMKTFMVACALLCAALEPCEGSNPSI